MKRNRTFLWLSLCLLVLLSACGTKPTEQTRPAEQPAASATAQPADPAANGSTQPEQQANLTKETIAVYYTDAELTQLVKEEQEISYRDQTDKYKQAIAALEKPAQAEHVGLWADFAYHSLTFADGTITIDTKGSNVYNLGAAGEGFALDALKQTLYQFPEVKKIVMLEDGQPIESLMGHVILEEALKK